MKLETVMKLIKENTNLLGYVNAKSLEAGLKDKFECMELRISIVREPECQTSNQEIFNTILIPLIKAKECLFRESLETLYVYSRSLFRLRIIDRACCLLNAQMSDKYKFTIMTNYEIISEEHQKEEIV
jgi:hypothetical protein